MKTWLKMSAHVGTAAFSKMRPEAPLGGRVFAYLGDNVRGNELLTGQPASVQSKHQTIKADRPVVDCAWLAKLSARETARLATHGNPFGRKGAVTRPTHYLTRAIIL